MSESWVCLATLNRESDLHMSNRTFVIGVGMTKFEKIETRDWEYPDMVTEAVSNALTDAGIGYGQIQRAAVGYVFNASTAGQRALYETGLTGIPIFNVNNNCATGSTALMEAACEGQADAVRALLAAGADPALRDTNGDALWYARHPSEGDNRKGAAACAHLLEEATARRGAQER